MPYFTRFMTRSVFLKNYFQKEVRLNLIKLVTFPFLLVELSDEIPTY
jgi:hypothetical protein